MGCLASSLVIASVGVIRVGSRGSVGVVLSFRLSLFNRGGARLEMLGIVVGSPSCGVRRDYFCMDSPLVRRILQRHVG